MEEILVKPGDVVVTNFTGYQHWSLVSDKVCDQGKFMLISATERNSTVQEEPWSVVTDGKHTYVAEVETAKPVTKMLADARSQIGKWTYSLTDNNCEHFVKWATGLKITSTQVKAGVGGGIVGAGMVAALSENPKLAKFLFGALFVGGLAVFASRAVEKSKENS